MNSGSFRLFGDETERSMGSSAGILACAGLLNALIAAVLLCRLPESSAPSFFGLLARASIYVLISATAGAAGTWFYWRRSSHSSRLNFPVSIAMFNLACVGGWVWVPAVVLLLAELSPAAVVIAAIGASILGIRLRKIFPPVPHLHREEYCERELFALPLQTPTFRSHGYAIAICVYAAAFALHDRSMWMASALLATGAFVFAWESTFAGIPTPGKRRVAMRLVWVVISAILVTFWALLDGVAHRGRMDAGDVALAHANDSSRGEESKTVANDANPGFGQGGYESIILWPLPPKKQMIPPLPERTELLAPGTSRPLIIRFDGPYWYFQPPETRPGPNAHEARGTPLSAHVRSNNSFPLSMEAHQSLGSAIRLSRCREMEVEIENREDEPNAVALAVLLTDSTVPGKPQLYLGQQVLKSTLPDRVEIKGAPTFETLRFEIPPHAKIRKFDRITVMILPDVGPALAGPKIAIQQFQLFPR